MSLQQSYYILFVILLTGCSPAGSAPLWPGSKYTETDRTRALLRALEFIHRSAGVPENFAAQGQDYLYCFYSIAATARDPELREAASALAKNYARKWSKTRAVVPPRATVDEIDHFVYGWPTAVLLGESDAGIKPQLQKAAACYTAKDFLLFDPAVEPPPADVPEACEFDDANNPRGSKVCRKCGRPLEMRSKYSVWVDALIVTYFGHRYGVYLGGSFRDVIKWSAAMRPYPERAKVNQNDFLDVLYALTHVVYTLNDYGHYLLPRDLLPQEFAYLRANLPEAIALHDPETMGEFLDALKAFGLDSSDPIIRTGITYLLDTQRPDGTWSPQNETDYYTLYHAAWTGIDGLKDCRWQGERLSNPDLRPLLESLRNTQGPQ